MDSSQKMIKASVTASTNSQYNFPEQTTEFLAATTNCGICFSGGGTRAMSAAMGQMRGLNNLGILKNARYISCVSGGSWASSVYTYYKSGPSNDNELLGTSPNSSERLTWTLTDWTNNLASYNLAYPATSDFRNTLLGYMDKHPINMAWSYAVRDVFFQPFGLDDANYFSLDSTSVDNALNANKTLQPNWSSDNFDITQSDRPYLIVNGTLMWPIEVGHTVNRVLVQFTPLYTGNPFALQLKEKHLLEKPSTLNTGGGVLDSYAFGSSGPNTAPGKALEMPEPTVPFSIWHASGISSTAYGYDFAKYHVIEGYIPQMNYWAVTDSSESQSETAMQYFADGGNLENNGIMAMLQRKVEKIIVFVNSETPISKNAKGTIVIDSDMPSYFGLQNAAFPNNTLFESSEYQTLLDGLWESNKTQNGLAMHSQTYTTIENTWFGTPSYSVEVLWVYNSPVQKWIDTLSPDMQATVNEGISGKGPLKNFPNYSTIGEEWFHLVELSAPQVSTIADMFAWSIEQNASTFEALLAPTSTSNEPEQ
ncbi:MAG: hypothetical protein ACRBEE_00945 [Arenicella sp.]